jgi:hypothetical protein
MCRGKNVCSELGTNPNNWDLNSLLPTPNWFVDQIDIFEAAVNEFIAGDKEFYKSVEDNAGNKLLDMIYEIIRNSYSSAFHLITK